MYASKERKYRVQEKHPGIAMGLFQVFLSWGTNFTGWGKAGVHKAVVPSLLEGLFLFPVLISWPLPRAQHAGFGDEHPAPVKDPEAAHSILWLQEAKRTNPSPQDTKRNRKGCLSIPAGAIKKILLCCSLSCPTSLRNCFSSPALPQCGAELPLHICPCYSCGIRLHNNCAHPKWDFRVSCSCCESWSSAKPHPWTPTTRWPWAGEWGWHGACALPAPWGGQNAEFTWEKASWH